MLKRVLFLIVFALSLSGCNWSTSPAHNAYSYDPYLTHITINQKNLPPQWQELPNDLIINFNEEEKNFLNQIIASKNSNIIHFYWLNEPNQPTRQTIAVDQTKFEKDISIPSTIKPTIRKKYSFFGPIKDNLPTSLTPSESFLTIHHITNRINIQKTQDLEYYSLLHFIDKISSALPINLYHQNDQITLSPSFNQTPQNDFNYFLKLKANQYLDTLIVNQISTQLNNNYLDFSLFNPVLLQSISYNHETYQLTYKNSEINQQIFTQIKQSLATQNTYNIVTKTLPDNTDTLIHQISDTTLDPSIDNDIISYQNENQELVYIINKNNSILISPDLTAELLPLVVFPFNPVIYLTPHLSEQYQFTSITYDTATNKGIINI